jgi:peptidoglycan hydrolase CwlO-like protein
MPNPDIDHQKYYTNNPSGNHAMPSPETLRFMEKQYQINEEIRDSLGEISNHLIKIDDKLEVIQAQTIKTNGRVNALEEESDCLKEEFLPMIKEIAEERKDKKSKIRDLLWEGVRIVLIASITGIATLVGFKEFFN